MRLVALSLTFTFLVAISVVTLDLAAWQCAPIDRCARHFPPLGWVADLEPGARLAIAALDPHSSSSSSGGSAVRTCVAGQSPPGPAVEDARPPPREPDLLERRHVGAAAAGPAHLGVELGAGGAGPGTDPAGDDHDLGSWVVGVLLAFHLAVLAAGVSSRAPSASPAGAGRAHPSRTGRSTRLRWGSLALLGTGLVAAAVVPTEWPKNEGAFTSLPYLSAVVPILFYVQVGLLVVLAAAVCLQRPWTLGRENPGFAVALRGLAAPATAFSAWLVGSRSASAWVSPPRSTSGSP